MTTHALDLSRVEQAVEDALGWRHGSFLFSVCETDGAIHLERLASGWVYDILAADLVPALRSGPLALVCFGRATNVDTLVRSRCRATMLIEPPTGRSTIVRLQNEAPSEPADPAGPVADIVTSALAYHSGL